MKSILSFLLIVFFAFQSYADVPMNELIIETHLKQSIPFQVEIADTKEKQKKGLMGRDSLKPRTGMLFVFEKPAKIQFWMKDAKIFLDMIFIGEDGVIKGIHEKAIPYDTTPITAPEPVLAVLEIEGGTAKTLGISRGDKVIHKIFEKGLK